MCAFGRIENPRSPAPYPHATDRARPSTLYRCQQFTVPSGDAFSTIRVPFDSFSVDWSDFTGECDTKDPTGEQHVCCTAAHPEVCPKDYHLAKLTGFGIWAEGVEGQFAIDLKSISAGP